MLFLTMAIAPITLTLVGFKIETTFMNPATSADPHLSLDIPAILPKIYMKYSSFIKSREMNTKHDANESNFSTYPQF